MRKLALNGSHCEDDCDVMYVDVLRPTIERHPIELLRRPDVRSVGTGSILIRLSFLFLSSSCCCPSLLFHLPLRMLIVFITFSLPFAQIKDRLSAFVVC